MKAFPKTIIVSREDLGNDDTFLAARTEKDLGDFNESTPVAIYRLDHVTEVAVNRTIVTKTAPSKA